MATVLCGWVLGCDAVLAGVLGIPGFLGVAAVVERHTMTVNNCPLLTYGVSSTVSKPARFPG